jgi:GT2 family glycosyltransferase
MINIIILNWNSAKNIEFLLNNIAESSHKKFRVILVDNHSKINDTEYIKKIYRKYFNLFETHLICNKKNYGYAGGNNKAYEYLSRLDLKGNILILNPDVIILPDTIRAMQYAMSDNVGGVMIRTLSNDASYTKMYDFLQLKGFMQNYINSENLIVDTDYLAGSCMLLNRDVIDDIGLFNEDFFMYWEDVELSLRIKAKGLRIVSTTESHILRSENNHCRNSNAVYYSSRNAFKLYRMYHCFSAVHLLIYETHLSVYTMKSFIVRGDYEVLKSYFKGVVDGIKALIK